MPDAAGLPAYQTYVGWLKWLTLALLASVVVAFMLHLDWRQVVSDVMRPRLAFSHDMLLMVVTVFGTTISPYLFFWQAGQRWRRRTAAKAWPAGRAH